MIAAATPMARTNNAQHHILRLALRLARSAVLLLMRASSTCMRSKDFFIVAVELIDPAVAVSHTFQNLRINTLHLHGTPPHTRQDQLNNRCLKGDAVTLNINNALSSWHTTPLICGVLQLPLLAQH